MMPYFNQTTAFHRIRSMGLAEDIDIWERGSDIVICPAEGRTVAEIVAKLHGPDWPGQTAEAFIRAWFGRAFAGSNVHWQEEIDAREHRPLKATSPLAPTL